MEFSEVPWRQLFWKLKSFEIPAKLCQRIEDLLQGRTFAVMVAYSYSAWNMVGGVIELYPGATFAFAIHKRFSASFQAFVFDLRECFKPSA